MKKTSVILNGNVMVQVPLSKNIYVVFLSSSRQIEQKLYVYTMKEKKTNSWIVQSWVVINIAFPIGCFSHSGKFLLLGMDDGVLRIHPLDGSNNFEHFSSFWALNVHDNHHGGIRHIKSSFDDKYVFTAGLDGNFFVFRFMDEAVKGLKVPHKVSIPSAKVR